MFDNIGSLGQIIEHYDLDPNIIANVADESISEKLDLVSKKYGVPVIGMINESKTRPRFRIFGINSERVFVKLTEWNLGEEFIPPQAAGFIKAASLFIKGLNRKALIQHAEESTNNALRYSESMYVKQPVAGERFGITVVPTKQGIKLVSVVYAETHPITIIKIKEAPEMGFIDLILQGLNTVNQLPPHVPAPDVPVPVPDVPVPDDELH